ncbi:MFS transporter [Thalassobaculum sp. OXR-137]|uniref:MFS transporter n=1 Tax=Thalassobaculum sp. OXR-137 TaxID=3100173 RepID=UPI002AC9A9DB|nr:MFS transporter [Thalassobaculum sp. OXR-137]WPZ36773.1 MFS transporter [Thalassobaculum sp. OXR-137]
MTTETPAPAAPKLIHLLAGDAAGELAEQPKATRAYLLNVANGACTKLAEKLAGPDLVLPWLLGAIAAPSGIAAMLMPAKQAGSLLPQLMISGWIRTRARRKWVWVAAGLLQALCLLTMVAAALWFPAAAAGWSIVGLLLAFSIASGCGSVAFQDVTPKTVPSGARGRMLANRSAIGGAFALATGVWLSTGVTGTDALSPLLILIGAAAVLWAAAALLFAGIPEDKSEPGEGRDPLEEIRHGVKLMREVKGFRRFLAARSALLSVEMATPIFVLFAQNHAGATLDDLGIYMVASGLAAVLSSPIWGAFSDDSARKVMTVSAVLGVVAAASALALPAVVPEESRHWAFAGVFLILGVAVAGVRLGRKTYLADGAPEEERPLYVAFSNTAAGIVAIGFMGLGVVAEVTNVSTTVIVLGALSALGVVLSRTMPKASRMAEAD